MTFGTPEEQRDTEKLMQNKGKTRMAMKIFGLILPMPTVKT